MENGGWRLIGIIILGIISFCLRILVRYYFIKKDQDWTKEASKERQKIEFMKENTCIVETLYNAHVPADKIMEYLNNRSFYERVKKQEKACRNERNDSLVSEILARDFYEILLFNCLPENLVYFQREFYMFRYFLIDFFSKFFLGENQLYYQTRKKFKNIISVFYNSERVFSQWYNETEIFVLATEIGIKYRNNIVLSLDNSNHEAISLFVIDVFKLTLKKDILDKTTFDKIFCKNVKEFLIKEYFDVREKIRDCVREIVYYNNF